MEEATLRLEAASALMSLCLINGCSNEVWNNVNQMADNALEEFDQKVLELV